jgi:hypothetical protein
MAILRSLDGKFYELPDEDLEKFEMSEEKVKEMGGDVGGGEMAQPEGGDPGMMHQDPPGTININLNLGGGGGGGQMMPPPQQQQGQQGEQQQQQGDVQGHGWVIYHNRYYAYRNRYWAYRNRY